MENSHDKSEYNKGQSSDHSLKPHFDKSTFPIVYVTFKKSIDNESFDYFIHSWLECYNYKKDFTFVFNLEAITWFNPSYCYRIAKFMKKLRAQREALPYLKTSIIVLTNPVIRKLVKFVFSIQAPQSHVYLAPDLIHANGIVRGNKEFIDNCHSILPDTKISLTGKERQDLKKIESTKTV